MKLKYFIESAYNDLYDTISQNSKLYYNDDGKWVEKRFDKKNFCKESRIDVSLPPLDAKSDEYTNVLAIHNAFRDKINPKQASNLYLWTYLAHCEYWDYTYERWSKANMSIDTIKQRFFCGPEEGNRIGFLRNSISRLWWFGYLTFQDDPSNPNPYELTKLMLSNTDLCQSIIERNFSMNKEISIGILSAIKEINDNPNMRDVGAVSNGDHYEWRALCKYINRYGGVVLLDTLTRNEVKELSYEFLLNYRKKWNIQ